MLAYEEDCCWQSTCLDPLKENYFLVPFLSLGDAGVILLLSFTILDTTTLFFTFLSSEMLTSLADMGRGLLKHSFVMLLGIRWCLSIMVQS